MMIKEIEGWGELNHNHEDGTVIEVDDIVWLLVKYGMCTDANGYVWEFHHNIVEEFYIACYDLGIEHSFLGFDDYVIGIRKFIAGEL